MEESPPSINRLLAELEYADPAEIARALVPLHPADAAELLSRLPEETRHLVFGDLSFEDRAELLEHLPEELAAELAEALPSGELAQVLDEMPPNLAADILGDLDEDRANPVLAEMEDSGTVTALLEHEEDTAGGIMTPHFVAVRQHMTVASTIEFLRSAKPDVGAAYYLYAVDERSRLVGVVGLRELITALPDVTIESIMSTEVFSVTEGTDQEEVARMMTKYRLAAIPVVDERKILTGVVTSEELVDVIEEEATEDIYRLANLSDSELQVWSPVRLLIAKRLPWLYLNLGTAFLAAWVVSLFETTIAQLAVLATFQGVVAGQGGNAGTQILAMMVRGIALGEIQFADVRRALRREVVASFVNGVAVGTAVGLAAWAWKGMPMLGVVIALSMVGNLVAAGIAGTLVPLTLRALRLDPALASAVLVTAVTDCVGFGLFLGLATQLLHLL